MEDPGKGFAVSHNHFWEKLHGRSHEEVCSAAGATPAGDGKYGVRLAGEDYVVDAGARTVLKEDGEPAGFGEQIVLLTYLATARPVPLTGRWVSGRSFPLGDVFFRGVHEMPVQPLAQLFQEDPGRLRRAVEALSGKTTENGDFAFEIDALPRVPIRFHIWAGDDEFEPECRVLFDRSADSFLLLDGILALVKLSVKRLVVLAG